MISAALASFALLGAAPPLTVSEATALVQPAKGQSVSGKVTFRQVSGGVEVIADIEGLTPGKHGFHIHEKGDCSAPDFASAGGHFNPDGKKHGGPDSPERHIGDLGNLYADAQGKAHYERVDSYLKLNGDNSIIGRSIVIHAKPDDYTTQPTGNSGDRIGCGLIQAVK